MKFLTSLFIVLLTGCNVYACSVYKITVNNRTFVGNNEDYWDPNTKMWFEKGKNGSFGNMYVGFDNFYPQGGMNEKGLVFDGFSVDPKEMKSGSKKPTPGNDIIKHIMQTCQNTDEVYNIVEKYDLTTLLYSGMWIFIDAAGNYLVVEGDVLTKGDDKNYLLSNFCPSQTSNLDQVDIPFYQKGRKFMAEKTDTTLSYLSALSDTLHQSFPYDLGGTQYTTIYDLKEKVIHLYYYHDYSKSITIHLMEELNKEDKVQNIPDLFPDNVSSRKNIQKVNGVKDFLKELSNPLLSSDYSKIKEEILARDLSFLISLFENDLNAVGYELLNQTDKTAAINIFKLNVEYFPNSWNVYDSLGDGYVADGNYELAIINYKQSLKLNPNNQNAINQIEKLTKK
jgi:tetratricopeptide (TPR) repeat protein